MQVKNLFLQDSWIDLTFVSPWIVDKTGERFFHMAGWWWMVILGYIVAMSTFSIAGRYVSLFLMACGYVGQLHSLLVIHHYYTLSWSDLFILKKGSRWRLYGFQIQSHDLQRKPSIWAACMVNWSISSSSKRAAAIGIVNGCGNIGAM